MFFFLNDVSHSLCVRKATACECSVSFRQKLLVIFVTLFFIKQTVCLVFGSNIFVNIYTLMNWFDTKNQKKCLPTYKKTMSNFKSLILHLSKANLGAPVRFSTIKRIILTFVVKVTWETEEGGSQVEGQPG